MRKLPMKDLVRKADTIVLGTVIQQESAWDAQHTAIYTDVTLAVERVLAGTPGEVVTPPGRWRGRSGAWACVRRMMRCSGRENG